MELFAPQRQLITLRPYQREATDAIYRHLRERDDNPCVVIPTGGGKTPIIAAICRDTVNLWSGRVLVLAHVKELLEQAFEKLRQTAPDIDIGIYSAGLGRRDRSHAVIVAGIQSVHQRADALGHFDLVFVDEAHMIPPDGDGMYRRFLDDAKKINPHLRVIGLTATPFRLSSGSICVPPRAGILNSICYEVGVRELIADGFLAPLHSKAGKMKPNLADVHVRAGEFVAGEVEAAMDQEFLVQSACREILEQTRDRRACLIFASSVKHGQHVAKVIEQLAGTECGFIDGQTPMLFRDQVIRRFRDGNLKFLCNVNVLTTGFDAPNVDCVTLLRPTMSPGLYCQMVGRGFRLAPGKADCLVLDFGGNVLRHGPVDQIRVTGADQKQAGEAPAKECPQCQALIATGYASCPECGHVFPPPERRQHEPTAGVAGILSGQVTSTEHPVRSVHYSVHQKKGAAAAAPKSMRVDYEIGYYQYKSEWVCVEHTGYAQQKAQSWWRLHSAAPMPSTARAAVDMANAGALAETLSITVRSVAGESFDRITDYELGAVPEFAAETDLDTAAAGPEPDYVVAEDDIPF